MIRFQISAPASLSLFGEQTDNIIKTTIDLRTTLNFQELDSSNHIEINFPEINIFHNIPLQEFLKLYDECIKNIEQLNLQVSKFTRKYVLRDRRFLKIFYYLLVYIMYEQQIAREEIKTFRIDLSTKLLMDKRFFCLTPLKVCLAACFLHWTRLQKNIHNTFDNTDLKNICIYATLCEFRIVSALDTIDIVVCAYGSMARCDIRKQDTYKNLHFPRKTILLVDSKQMQDVEAQKQRVRELTSSFSHISDPILKGIDFITNVAAATLQQIFDIFNDNELNGEIKTDHFLYQYEILEVSHVT